MSKSTIKNNMKLLKQLDSQNGDNKDLIKQYRVLLGVIRGFHFSENRNKDDTIFLEKNNNSLDSAIAIYKEYFKSFKYIYSNQIRQIIDSINLYPNRNDVNIKVFKIDIGDLLKEEEYFLFSINEKYLKIYLDLIEKGSILVRKEPYIESFIINDTYNKDSSIFISQEESIQDIFDLTMFSFDAIKNGLTDYRKPINEAGYLLDDTFKYLGMFLLMDFYRNNFNRKILLEILFDRKINDISKLITLSKKQIKLFNAIESKSNFSLNDFDSLFPYSSEMEFSSILDFRYNKHISEILSFFTALEFYLQFKSNRLEFFNNIDKFLNSQKLSDINLIYENSSIDYNSVWNKEKCGLLKEKRILF